MKILFLQLLFTVKLITASFIVAPRSSSNRIQLRAYLPDDAGVNLAPTNYSHHNLDDDVLISGGDGKVGKISMIGAGPGDPELLTMAAHRIITSTEQDPLIVADRLVSPEIIALCQGEVRTARKLPGCAENAQREIYEWCREGLIQGRHVVRLKIGDPFVFGRGGEEVLEFRKMGFEPDIIPGVSAAFSAPLLAGIPVTHRGVSNQVVMCTGYGRNGTSPDLIQYHKEQTVVFLMAVGRLRELCQNLINMANYPVDTPVAIVENAGCPEQRTLVGDMSTIADLSVEHNIKAPSTIVVGGVVTVLLDEENKGISAIQGLIERAQNVEVSE